MKQLPTRDLRRVNPKSMGSRVDYGDMDALAKSVKQWGLIYPILLGYNNEILDGYRRLEAAEMNRMSTVPVHYAVDYPDIVEQINKSLEGPEFLRMHWLEMGHRIARVLRPWENSDRGKIAAQARKEGRKYDKRRSDESPRREMNARLFGVDVSTYRGASQLFHIVQNWNSPFATKEDAERYIRECEDGGFTVTVPLRDLRWGITERAAARERLREERRQEIEGRQAVGTVKQQTELVEKSCGVVSTLSDELLRIFNMVNPEMTVDEARRLASLIGQANFGLRGVQLRLSRFANKHDQSKENNE